MRRWISLGPFMLLGLLLLIDSASAERRVALVIGNATYQNVARLPNPANDAADVAKAFKRLGFSVRHATDLDFDGLRRTLRDFGNEAAGADMAAIFFAGHGLELNKQNYIVPIDAQLLTDRDVALETIPLDHLLAAVEGARGLRLIFLDACRNNPFVASMKFSSTQRSVGRGLTRVDPGGILVSFSAKEGTIAADGSGRNSPFTAALLQHVEEPGLEIRLLLGRVHDSVMEATARAQEPHHYGALGGDAIYLKPPSREEATATSLPAAAIDRRLAEAAQVWAVTQASTSTEVLKAFIVEFADTPYANLARARLREVEGEVATLVPRVEPATTPSHLQCGAGFVTQVGLKDQCLKPGDEFRDCEGCPEMVVIPAGSFMMGSPENEGGRTRSEGPQHRVTIGKPFAVGKFEVTFDEWDACVADGGCSVHSLFKGRDDKGWGRGRRPVIFSGWRQAKAYVEWLSRKTHLNYRLLSEAEWEYAARAGTTTPFSTGNAITTDQANFGWSREKTIEVGSFPPNAFGLYDMQANVSEMVEDCSEDSYAGAPADGSAWTTPGCGYRVIRGGSWRTKDTKLRSAFRAVGSSGDYGFSSNGFRVARTLIH